MPIIYNESVRTVLFDFLSRKINVQYAQLKKKNKNAFVWLDEPGLGWVFSGLSGYDDLLAKMEYRDFLQGLSGPGSLHLCANVNLPYLLRMGTALLSFDAYQLKVLPKGYTAAILEFLKDGGIISWGIVPMDSFSLDSEKPHSLTERLVGYWDVIISNTDISIEQVADQALVAPARCCLKNIGQVGAADDPASRDTNGQSLQPEEQLVETAFGYLTQISRILKDKFDLQET